MRAKKIDKNQPQIVKNLRKFGFSVELDKDDIIVGKHGKTKWIEIKDGSPFQNNGKIKVGFIKDSQFRLLCEWQGQYNICWDVEQITKLFEIRLPFYKGRHEEGIFPYMFQCYFKEWLSDKELLRLRTSDKTKGWFNL